MTTKTDSNTTATGARIAHPVEISDLKAGTKYIAAWESECESETDRSAYREAVRCDDVVTMGGVVARSLTSRPAVASEADLDAAFDAYDGCPTAQEDLRKHRLTKERGALGREPLNPPEAMTDNIINSARMRIPGA